uniref:NB-ARC domain-containing protein n=1 Tax=Oryza punctata TaxID=4537 RepID=A0A0E0MML4_ORYPU
MRCDIMEGPKVTSSMGVMFNLLSKLNTSMDQPGFKDVRGDMNSLKDELGNMKALMHKFATQDESMDLQVKEWMRQVREVGYDTEDWIDSYPPVSAEAMGARLASGFFNRNSRRRKLAELIKELKDRVKEASKRRSRYLIREDWDDAVIDNDEPVDLGPSNVTVDRQLLYGLDGMLVGTIAPTNELVGKLRAGGDQHFRVVSIVGAGGLGKTTLAREVYRTIHGEFDCCAFVTVGQNPHIRAVLLSLLHQLNPPQRLVDDTEQPMDELTVVGKLREFLEEKRYFIVVDDIWSASTWRDIKCALPENSTRGSRIVTTTRMNDVAKSCSGRPIDFTHLMKPLNEADSKQLFSSRLQQFLPEEACEAETGDAVLEEKLFRHVWKICGGTPLAIIVMAGMFNRKSPDWFDHEDNIEEAVQKYPTLQGMRRTLRICYSDLTLPVKTCLLYLSIFPEGATMEKKRLIWRWIAEGFIPNAENDKVTPWETAESYFNDLVTRRLIQPAESGDAVRVKVHNVVLEFISSVAGEENFVTSQVMLRSKPRDVVRRLSLNGGSDQVDVDGESATEQDAPVNLSQVRSLTVFGALPKSMMSSIVYLQLLRVLDSIAKLPEKWKELQNLQTLDVRETDITELPEAIARRCNQLACLLARRLAVREGMESMLQLQELSMVSVTDAASLDRMTKLVVSLNKLRKLGVSWSFDGTGDQHAMAALESGKLAASLQQIEKCGVESLLLDVVGEGKTRCSLDLLVESWAPPRRLQKFTMRSLHYYFPKAPPKMATHESLSHLEISIAELRKSDVDVLCSMPSLFYLKLSTRSSQLEAETVVITNKGFQCLQVWWFKCEDGGLGFDFGEGAMAQLLKLDLHFTPGKKAKLPCISNLSSLRQLHATVCCGNDDSEFKVTEETIKQLVSNHSNNPTWEVTMELDKPSTSAS